MNIFVYIYLYVYVKVQVYFIIPELGHLFGQNASHLRHI